MCCGSCRSAPRRPRCCRFTRLDSAQLVPCDCRGVRRRSLCMFSFTRWPLRLLRIDPSRDVAPGRVACATLQLMRGLPPRYVTVKRMRLVNLQSAGAQVPPDTAAAANEPPSRPRIAPAAHCRTAPSAALPDRGSVVHRDRCLCCGGGAYSWRCAVSPARCREPNGAGDAPAP